MEEYLVFGTVHRNAFNGKKTVLGAPFECYRVRENGEKLGDYIIDEIKKEGNEITFSLPTHTQYEKVMKWIKRRKILDDPLARCKVHFQDITRLL